MPAYKQKPAARTAGIKERDTGLKDNSTTTANFVINCLDPAASTQIKEAVDAGQISADAGEKFTSVVNFWGPVFRAMASAKPSPGYLYFAKNESGNIKIGFSAEPTKRLKSLHSNTGSDKRARISLIALIAFESAREARNAEVGLHKKFARHRVHGEWFRPVTPLLDEIARLTKTEN